MLDIAYHEYTITQQINQFSPISGKSGNKITSRKKYKNSIAAK